MYIYGKRLREYREKTGITQNEMCRKLGMKQGNYSRLEKGEQDIKISMLLTICNELNLSADWLLGIGEYKQEPTQIINIISRNSAAISNDNE